MMLEDHVFEFVCAATAEFFLLLVEQLVLRSSIQFVIFVLVEQFILHTTVQLILVLLK
jgi:hypothetical protein